MLDNFRVRLSGLGPVALRVALAIVFICHGWDKFLTLVKTGHLKFIEDLIIQHLTAKAPYPQVLGWAAGLTEFVGGVCIALGLLTRFWSAGLVIQMAVALTFVHASQGLITHVVEQPGQPQPSAVAPATMPATATPAEPVKPKPSVAGYEFPLSLGLVALALFLLGPGPLSLDYVLGRAFRGPNANAIVGCGMRYPACSPPPSTEAEAKPAEPVARPRPPGSFP